MATIKKILLIITPTTDFKNTKGDLSQKNTEFIPQPLGLAYLGSVLRTAGYEVEIFDPHIEVFDQIEKFNKRKMLKSMISTKINNSEYDVIGISSVYIYTYEWAHYIAKIAKQKSKGIPVVIGGGYPSLLVEKVLSDINIDYLVRGEGEVTFIQLLSFLETENAEDLKKIEGIAYRLNGEAIFQPRIHYIEKVDDIPFPAWDLINIEKYMLFEGKRRFVLISSRGCPYACTFCNSHESWGRGFRQRSSENILKEIDYLIDKYRAEDLLFVDDNMTVNKKRFMEIVRGIKERNITWQAINVSSFTTDDEMLMAMKDSGCYQIAIAVESAVPETLKKMRKPVNLKRSKEIVKFCRKIGLQCTLFYISGLPYDTKEDMIKTFKFSEEVRADWNQYSMLVPFPGTDIFKECIDKGYFIDDELDLSQLTIHNEGFIETENWNKEWVSQTTYDYNIKTNFLRNYNLIEDDGDLNAAVDMFEYVVKFHPHHIIAVLCLLFAYNKNGKTDKKDKMIEKAAVLMKDKNILKTYGKYLEWDEEVINFYKKNTERITINYEIDNVMDIINTKDK